MTSNSTEVISNFSGPVCVFGLSGLGKTHLAGMYPNLVIDTDRALDKATEEHWADLSPYNRRRAWRAFCARKPWLSDGPEFTIWADIRREYTSILNDFFLRKSDCLILTSEFNLPHKIDLHIGVELGRYEEHLELVKKKADNGQNETMNRRLEGHSPLIRVPPGSCFSDARPIREWLERKI